MSNADIGAASSRFAYNLILDLSGRVEDTPVQSVLISEVPESGTLALLRIGSAGLCFSRKNKS
jgi:hypothetical protein